MKKFCVFLFVLALPLSGCSQNIEVVNSGETLEDSPKPAADPNVKPLAAAAANAEGEDPAVREGVLHAYVGRGPLQSAAEQASESELAVASERSREWTRVVHRLPRHTGYRFFEDSEDADPHGRRSGERQDFMVGLMKKWVARLNSDEFGAKAKLKGTVTCLTCHATNPGG